MELIIALGVGTLFGIAVYQILQRNVIRSAIGIILLGSAINLFCSPQEAQRAYTPAYTTFESGVRADALPQALVLTAIVISMGGLAFILAMLYVISARYGTGDLEQVSELRN